MSTQEQEQLLAVEIKRDILQFIGPEAQREIGVRFDLPLQERLRRIFKSVEQHAQQLEDIRESGCERCEHGEADLDTAKHRIVTLEEEVTHLNQDNEELRGQLLDARKRLRVKGKAA